MVHIDKEECEAWIERDFVSLIVYGAGSALFTVTDFEQYGYGQNPPDPKWPNGAKIAVNFVMNHVGG
jgi:hypothetical protein